MITRTVQPSIGPLRQRARGVVQERRLHLLELERQCDPGLDAVQPRRDGEVVAGALGVHDAAAGRHEVHGTGLDELPIAQAVAVHDLAFEEVSDRREPDVRMRAHGDAVVRRKHGGPHVIEEHERPHHAPFRRGQYAANVEFAEAAHARLDRQLDGCRGRELAQRFVFSPSAHAKA